MAIQLCVYKWDTCAQTCEGVEQDMECSTWDSVNKAGTQTVSVEIPVDTW
jgi:hypothetical protein